MHHGSCSSVLAPSSVNVCLLVNTQSLKLDLIFKKRIHRTSVRAANRFCPQLFSQPPGQNPGHICRVRLDNAQYVIISSETCDSSPHVTEHDFTKLIMTSAATEPPGCRPGEDTRVKPE